MTQKIGAQLLSFMDLTKRGVNLPPLESMTSEHFSVSLAPLFERRSLVPKGATHIALDVRTVVLPLCGHVPEREKHIFANFLALDEGGLNGVFDQAVHAIGSDQLKLFTISGEKIHPSLDPMSEVA